jgi:hypothetical protein
LFASGFVVVFFYRCGTSLPQIVGNKAGNLWITHGRDQFLAGRGEKTAKGFD